MNNIQINLSGKDGEIHYNPKAKDGIYGVSGDAGKDYNDHDGKNGKDGANGEDGKPGNNGMDGGDFLGVGNRLQLSDTNYKIFVISNGGDGSNGQYGGNGGNGGNGGDPYRWIRVNPQLMSEIWPNPYSGVLPEISKHEDWPTIIGYDERYPNHHKGEDSNLVYRHLYTTLSIGGKGGNAGNSGKDGDKSYGGKKGTIQLLFPANFFNLSKNINTKSSDGKEGLQARGNKELEARGGIGGANGKLYTVQIELGTFIENKATYALMVPKENGHDGFRNSEINTNQSKESKTVEKISSYNEMTDYLKYVMIEESLYSQDFINSFHRQNSPKKITELSNKATMLNEIFRAK